MKFSYYSDSFFIPGVGYMHMTINAIPGDEMIIITGSGDDIRIDPLDDRRLYDEAIEMLGDVTRETMIETAAMIIGRRDRMLSEDARYYWDNTAYNDWDDVDETYEE